MVFACISAYGNANNRADVSVSGLSFLYVSSDAEVPAVLISLDVKVYVAIRVSFRPGHREINSRY